MIGSYYNNKIDYHGSLLGTIRTFLAKVLDFMNGKKKFARIFDR